MKEAHIMENNHDEFNYVIELVIKLDGKQVKRMKELYEERAKKNSVFDDTDDVIELDEEEERILDELYEEMVRKEAKKDAGIDSQDNSKNDQD